MYFKPKYQHPVFPCIFSLAGFIHSICVGCLVGLTTDEAGEITQVAVLGMHMQSGERTTHNIYIYIYPPTFMAVDVWVQIIPSCKA